MWHQCVSHMVVFAEYAQMLSSNLRGRRTGGLFHDPVGALLLLWNRQENHLADFSGIRPSGWIFPFMVRLWTGLIGIHCSSSPCSSILAICKARIKLYVVFSQRRVLPGPNCQVSHISLSTLEMTQPLKRPHIVLADGLWLFECGAEAMQQLPEQS